MKEHHNSYSKSDVLLLADIFENFTDICVRHYGLDSAWYITAPRLAWAAGLKMTKVELELSSDLHILLMIESGIRRGRATISQRNGKARNKYTETEFDSEIECKFTSYMDACGMPK